MRDGETRRNDGLDEGDEKEFDEDEDDGEFDDANDWTMQIGEKRVLGRREFSRNCDDLRVEEEEK